MLSKYGRTGTRLVFTPVARGLLRIGVTSNVVTIVGTLGVVASAIIFYPRGELLWGTLAITAFIFTDSIDGLMAKMSDSTSPWGAFLDSLMDRFGDAAVFGTLALWFAGAGQSLRMAALLIACLALASIVSYAKARAESLGFQVNGGIAQRTERLVTVLVTTGLVGLFDLPIVVLEVVLWVVLAASAWTVWQRVMTMRRQSHEVA